MPWTFLKQLHVTLAVLTASSFALRGYWMLSRSPRLETAAARWLPHVVDSLLFLTGVAMAFGLAVSPLSQPWFAAKLAAIAVYIGAGHVALKRGRTYRQRVVAFVLSLIVLAYIFLVALNRDPWAGLRISTARPHVPPARASLLANDALKLHASFAGKLAPAGGRFAPGAQRRRPS